MPDPEPRIVASGRDFDIYEHGPDRVLRRARDGRSLESEAATMRHVLECGSPVPRVWEANGPDLVMDRVDGPAMLDTLGKQPWTFRRHAAILADLHERLHRVPPPAGLLRRRFVDAFLSHFDRAAVKAFTPEVIDQGVRDRNVLPAEVEAMHRLVRE